MSTEPVKKYAPIEYPYGKLPNGWPQPTFLSTDDDGGINIEWCFGTQGADDSWRVSFCWIPDEGGMAIRTTRDHQDTIEKHNVGHYLDQWLREPPEAK